MAIVARHNKRGTVYQVKVKRRAGGWFPTKTFESLAKAKVYEGRLFSEAGQIRRQHSQDALGTTIDEYWEVWAADRRTEVSEGWRISQDQMYSTYVSPVIGSKAMAEVGKPEIGHVMNRAKDMGRSPQTRRHVYALLNSMFGDAVDYYEMLAANPVRAAYHRPKVPKGAVAHLKPMESVRLLEAASRHPYLGPAIWTGILASLRVEAVIGLAWRSVLWDSNQILICRAWKQKVGRMENFPKGRDAEFVPLPLPLKQYLSGQWERSEKNPEGFVCQGPSGGMLSYDTYIKAIKVLCKDAGVPVVTTHGLRHSGTELYYDNGATHEDLRRLLNHKSLTATARYIHRTDARLASIAGRLELPRLSVIDGGQAESFPMGNILGNEKASALDQEVRRHVN